MKRPLVVVVEDERLQQLQDGEHVAEERHVVLLPELQQVEVDAPMQKACDHRQVSGEGSGGEDRRRTSRQRTGLTAGGARQWITS